MRLARRARGRYIHTRRVRQSRTNKRVRYHNMSSGCVCCFWRRCARCPTRLAFCPAGPRTQPGNAYIPRYGYTVFEARRGVLHARVWAECLRARRPCHCGRDRRNRVAAIPGTCFFCALNDSSIFGIPSSHGRIRYCVIILYSEPNSKSNRCLQF